MDVLYRPVSLTFDSNTPGTSTYDLLFNAIIEQHPELNLNTTDYRLEQVQHLPGRYKTDRSVALVVHTKDPTQQLWFNFDRYRISRYIQLPLFEEAELPEVQAMTAQELAVVLVEKTGLNIDPRDFLIELVGIKYTGGEIRPNWRLQARPESPFWYGQIIIPLNDGKAPPPPPEPEPEPEPDPEPDPDPQPEPEEHYEPVYPPKYIYYYSNGTEIDIGPEAFGHLLIAQTRYHTPCYPNHSNLLVLPETEWLFEEGYEVGDHFKVLNIGSEPLQITPVEVFMHEFSPIIHKVALPPGAIVEVVLAQVPLYDQIFSGWIYRGDNLQRVTTDSVQEPIPE